MAIVLYITTVLYDIIVVALYKTTSATFDKLVGAGRGRRSTMLFLLGFEWPPELVGRADREEKNSFRYWIF